MFTGKDRECVFSNLHGWVCDEDHSIWFSSPSRGLPAQWMELARFYNSSDRVSISFPRLKIQVGMCEWIINASVSKMFSKAGFYGSKKRNYTFFLRDGWFSSDCSNDISDIQWKGNIRVLYPGNLCASTIFSKEVGSRKVTLGAI